MARQLTLSVTSQGVEVTENGQPTVLLGVQDVYSLLVDRVATHMIAEGACTEAEYRHAHADMVAEESEDFLDLLFETPANPDEVQRAKNMVEHAVSLGKLKAQVGESLAEI